MPRNTVIHRAVVSQFSRQFQRACSRNSDYSNSWSVVVTFRQEGKECWRSDDLLLRSLARAKSSRCCTLTGFKSKSPRYALNSSKNMFGCVFLPLFNQYAQCDDRRWRREDMSATSPSKSELFSGVYERPSKSWSGSDDEERGRFPNSGETDFG
jgi:hypothetical protein